MKKVITIGGALRDIFIEYKDPTHIELHTDSLIERFMVLQEGRKHSIDTVLYTHGGGAYNSAIAFARLGYSTNCCTIIGTDEAGESIVASLQAEHVNTQYIHAINTAPTGTSFIMPSPSGNRTVLVHRGASIELNQEYIPFDEFTADTLIYCTSLSTNTHPLLPRIAQTIRSHNGFIAVNPGTSQLSTGVGILQNALPYINILILNAYEAQLLFNHITKTNISNLNDQDAAQETIPLLLQSNQSNACFTLNSFFTLMHSTGVPLIVVTNDKEGVYLSDKNHIYFHPSMQTEVTCTVGAGDAFGSTFVAHYIKTQDLKSALHAGMLNAISVIKRTGATTGLLTNAQLQKKLTSTTIPKILQYEL